MASIDLAKYIATIEADTSGLSKGLDSADGLIQNKIGGMINWSKVAIAGMVTGVVASVGVTIKKGLDSFIEFENEMNTVYTLLPDITAESMSKMEQQVKDLSNEMGILPDEIIPALYQSLSASVPEENVFDFLEVAQKGAIAGMSSTETSVDALVAVINSYRMEADEAEDVSDILFTTIKNGITSMDELGHSLSNVTPVASDLGVSFGDVGAQLATITSGGTPTAQATTQMRQGLLELSKEGTKTSELFKELSGKSFRDFIAEGGNVNEALALMEQHAKDNDLSISDLFGSVQAGQWALQLTGENAEVFAENLENMANSAGATQQAYETMDNGIGRSFEKIKVAMSNMVLELGERLAPVVASAVDYIIEIMPTIQNVVETVFSVIGDVISVFVNIIDWLVENIKQFVVDNEELFTSVWETIEFTFNAIVEIIEIAIEIITKIWDTFGEYITKNITIVWDTISKVFKNALNIIKGILDVAIGLFTGDWERMGKGLEKIAKNLWEAIKTIFQNAFKLIENIMQTAISTLTGIAKSIMEGIFNAFKTVWNGITNWISNVFSALARTITNFGSTFYNAGRDIFNSVWDGLKDIWRSISSWVSDKVSWIADKLAFWRKSEKEMSSSSVSTSTPSYDVGTPFVPADGLAYLHKGEAVIPAQYNPFTTTNNAFGGNTININEGDIKLEVKGNLDKEILPEVRKMIDQAKNYSMNRLVNELNKNGIRPVTV